MELINNEYYFGGIKVADLAKNYDTPLYVYDTAVMQHQYERLLNAFKTTNIKVKYACKALTNLNVVKFFHKLGSGLDTVSIQEVELGLRAGFKPKDIIFTPNGVSLDEISAAVDLGVVINIDNISILEQFGHKYGSKVPISIRINPHLEGGGHYKISTGHIDSKFGISIHQLRHVERVINSTHLKVVGLHMHTGSDILDVEVFIRGVEILFENSSIFKDLDFIDLGSGIKTSYKENDIETDVEYLGESLSNAFNEFCDKRRTTNNEQRTTNMELWIEPGKFLVSKSGIFLVKVNVVKQTTATVFAGVNSGFNHLIRPMLYDSYHEIVNISNPEGRQRIYTVVGNICETDTFALDRKISEIHEGDILAFYNAGAYGFEMSSNYNSRLKPAEVMIMNGKDHLIRRRDTLEDLLKNQIIIEQ